MRSFRRANREPTRQVSLSRDVDSSGFDSSLDWEAIAREPSPAEVAALADTVDALLKPLRDSHRDILTLALQGYTQEEIGHQVGCSERTVRRDQFPHQKPDGSGPSSGQVARREAIKQPEPPSEAS
jgi:DNA-directed RNA polymerase specialized sigma24 family protein